MALNNRPYLLGASLLALLLLVVLWLWTPLRSAPAQVALLHAYFEGFTYAEAEAGAYLPLPANAQSLQQVSAALAALDPWPQSGPTAVSRARAAALAAEAQWEDALAVLAGAGRADNQVLAVTQAAVLEQAAAAQTDAARTDAAQEALLQAEQSRAWQQAFGTIDLALRTGSALRAMDKPAAATRLYQRAALAYGHYLEPWYYLATMQVEQGEPQQAITTLEQGLAATETTGRIGQSNLHYLIGRTRNNTAELNDPEAVYGSFTQAVTLADFGSQPGDESDVHFQLGHLAFAAGRWEQALDEYQQALEIDPANYYPQLTIAAALWQLGRQEEAFQQLENAIATYPSYKTAYQWLADLHRRAGQDEQARQVLGRLLAVDPADAEAQAAAADLTLLPSYVPGP